MTEDTPDTARPAPPERPYDRQSHLRRLSDGRLIEVRATTIHGAARPDAGAKAAEPS